MSNVLAGKHEVKLEDRLFREYEENMRRFYTQAVIKGEDKIQAVRIARAEATTKMLSIEGVMEVRNSQRFEAAVHTDEGPKTLEGRITRPAGRIEVQSGSAVETPSEWQDGIQMVSDAIRAAYEHVEPSRGLRAISTIWGELDVVSELAAARSHILMGKLEKPELAELPKWFADHKSLLSEHGEDELSASPLAVESAEFLVRAAMAALENPDELEAEIETGPLGRVIVDWVVPQGRLQWMVEASDSPWPSVKVYELTRRVGSEPTPPVTRILHSAFDVVASFIEFVSGS